MLIANEERRFKALEKVKKHIVLAPLWLICLIVKHTFLDTIPCVGCCMVWVMFIAPPVRVYAKSNVAA